MKFVLLISSMLVLMAPLDSAEPGQHTAISDTPLAAYNAAKERAGVNTGLVVQLGATDLDTARTLREAGAAHILLAVDDAERAQAMREQLATDAQLGVIEVLDRLDPQRVPLVDDAALLLVVENGEKAPEAELMRAVRPYGTMLREGKVSTKPWPEGYDGWFMYTYDASGSDISKDTKAGPLVGLQWVAGDISNRGQVGWRLVNGIAITAEVRDRPRMGWRESMVPVARDGFTGQILWQRPDLFFKNFNTFNVDDERVYLHTDGHTHQIALDVKTGETVTTFDQGAVFNPKMFDRGSRIAPPQSIIHDGKLIQIHHHELITLDAKSGKRLWAVDLAAENSMPYIPIIADGKLVVVVGPRKNITFTYKRLWQSMQLQELRAYDLESGALAWSWKEPTEHDHFVQSMSYADGAIGMLTWAIPEAAKGNVRGVERKSGYYSLKCFNPDGNLRWEEEVEDNVRAGHGRHYSSMIADQKLWLNKGNFHTGFDLKSGKSVSDLEISVPLCNVPRGAGDLIFHGAGAGNMTNNEFFSVSATRTDCDTGGFPGFGRLFLSKTGCGCTQFLPYAVAGLPHTNSAEIPDTRRLHKGKAQPAQAKANNDWPMYMTDAERTLWVDVKLNHQLSTAWQHQHVDPLASMGREQRADWGHNPWRSGTLTAPVAAQGLAVYALSDSGVVVARDLESGKQVWQAVLDGRIDTPPTIHKGLVLCGTRNGWVYALNRETGEQVWRFFAAPNQRQIPAQGATESAWPVNGSVMVIEDVVWFTAGRSVETDGGLWIWALEAETGAVKHKIRFDGTMEWTPTGKKVGRHRPYNLGQPLIYHPKEDWLLLFDSAIHRQTGEIISTEQLRVPHGAAPANRIKRSSIRSLAYNGVDRGGKYGDSMVYAGVRGKLIAHREEQMVALLDNGGAGNRGGGPKGPVVALWKIGYERLGKLRSAPALGERVWPTGGRNEWPIKHSDRDEFHKVQALAVAGDVALVNHGETLYVVDLKTGDIQSQTKLSANLVFAGIAVADGKVIVTCRDGSVICLK